MSSNTNERTDGDMPKIAVIGAGAAGLAATRALNREGYGPSSVTVLEARSQVGGVWKYDPDPAQTPHDTKAHPMYRGLRTNLPKELMAFREFPFSDTQHSDDSFVAHTVVQNYLQDYQEHFDLTPFIHFNAPVQSLQVLKDRPSKLRPNDKEIWPSMQVTWSSPNGSSSNNDDDDDSNLHSEVFDAVLICNGHYAAPSIPNIPGLEEYCKASQTKIVHSIAYDNPSDFAGQSVLCVGGRASGADVTREIAPFATHVYLSDTACQQVSQDDEKVTLVPKTVAMLPGGKIQFDHDCSITPQVDVILFCTGYDYSFPFLPASKDNELELDVTPGSRTVTPLYEQLWHAQAPSLTFVGLPHSAVPFPLFEFQVEAICAQWKQSALPTLADRLEAAKKDASIGGPKQTGRIQDTHFLGSAQWAYCRRMVELTQSKEDSLEAYLQTNEGIYNHASKARKSGTPGGPDDYRSIRYERPSWGSWRVLETGEARSTALTAEAKEEAAVLYSSQQ